MSFNVIKKKNTKAKKKMDNFEPMNLFNKL